ncbi:Protein PLANT CADMIUM RESISTANCE 4 [Bienertia sinuspersici]
MISGLHFVYACAYRGKLKRQIGIPSSPIEDLCTHIWCHPCVLCQEQRELHHHGYDDGLVIWRKETEGWRRLILLWCLLA